MSAKIICGDCDKDLTNIFCHYIIKGRVLCGFCRCQYNEKGISKTRPNIIKVINN